jgi:hypothetical protein
MNPLLRVSAQLVLLLVVPAASAEVPPRHLAIEAGGLTPPTLAVVAEEPVIFDNRSGERVHVQFLEEDGSHHLFQVTARIWAVFHRPGRHEYVVHRDDRPDLRGAIDVVEAPDAAGLPVCSTITVMGVCLER